MCACVSVCRRGGGGGLNIHVYIQDQFRQKVIVKMKDELISAVERYDAVVQLYILLCNHED